MHLHNFFRNFGRTRTLWPSLKMFRPAFVLGAPPEGQESFVCASNPFIGGKRERVAFSESISWNSFAIINSDSNPPLWHFYLEGRRSITTSTARAEPVATRAQTHNSPPPPPPSRHLFCIKRASAHDYASETLPLATPRDGHTWK